MQTNKWWFCLSSSHTSTRTHAYTQTDAHARARYLVVSRSSVSSSGIRLGFGVINLENTLFVGMMWGVMDHQ